jgi:hypothetical protein
VVVKQPKRAAFKPRKTNKQPVASHPLFVPMLVLWGAALAGLSVLVLPESMIGQLTRISGLSALGGLARLVFAGLAGMIGAAGLYFIGAALRPRATADAEEMPTPTHRRKRTLDPVSDLGSDSFDSPLDERDFADEDEFEDGFEDGDFDESEFEDADPGDADLDHEDAVAEPEAEDDDWHNWYDEDAEAAADAGLDAAFEPDEEPTPATRTGLISSRIRRSGGNSGGKKVELVKAMSNHLARRAEQARAIAAETPETPAPVASLATIGRRDASKPVWAHEDDDHLDLGAFAEAPELPDAPEATVAELPVASDTRTAPAEPHSAVEMLRAVPPQELSLVQMVERLALALHEHQAATRTKPQSRPSPERDVALAEALRTLSMFTDHGFEPGAAGPQEPGASAPTDETEREMRDALASLHRHRGAA